MSKFITKEFSIESGTGLLTSINGKDLSFRDHQKLTQGDVIYIYHGPKNIYIGQTKHFFQRHQQHTEESSGRYVDGSYTRVITAFGSLITQASLDDIEKQLITYVTADFEHSRNMTVNNETSGNESNNYSGQDDVLSEFIDPFWELLADNGYVRTKKLSTIKNSLLFKYSPFSSLAKEKQDIIRKIISTPQNYIISGLAGTGKTVVLTNLAAKLSQLESKPQVAVIVKSNWVKTAQSIFSAYNVDNVTVDTAYKLIKSEQKFDYILVDEAHRLRRYYSKGNFVTQDIFHKDESSNELKLLEPLGKYFVLFYDPSQIIRPNDIPQTSYQNFLEKYNFHHLQLTKEYRINGFSPNSKFTSDDFMTGILEFLQIKKDATPFNHELFKAYLTDDDAYFGVVDSIQDLFNYLDYSENYDPATQNRVMAGYTRPWISKKDKQSYDWTEDDHHWQWNSTNENWLKKRHSREEIGSIHAVQGIDLNYAGVIISNDIGLNSNGEVIGIPKNYKDRNGQYKKSDYDEASFSTLIKNIYYVLLTRGINGVRIYFEDKKMEQYFYDFMNINKVAQ